MGENQPLVSIGLPVFNGENYLEEALTAVLGQTFTDFELIITDNASTDKTAEICQTYLAQDDRIRYYRQEKNLGAAGNFNFAFEQALGKYFKWAAHDDIIAPDYLEKCVQILEQDPSVVLCHSQVRLIDETGAVWAEYDTQLTLHQVGSPQPHQRFRDLILIPHYCFDVFGLIRTQALKGTPLIASHIGSDRNLLVELGLIGRFHLLPEKLFLSRDHSARSIKAMSLHDRAQWFDTKKTKWSALPRWRVLAGYLKSLQRVPLSRAERWRCYAYLPHWLVRYGRGLVKDLLVAMIQIGRSFSPSKTNQPKQLQNQGVK